MTPAKRKTILYWVLTVLVLLPTAGSGVPELFTSGPRMTVQSLHALGYPPYLMKILGLSKILGAVAIVTGWSATLKEWAYAGFTFLFVGATASHLLAGDAVHAPAPLVCVVLLMGSYALWDKPGTEDGRRPA